MTRKPTNIKVIKDESGHFTAHCPEPGCKVIKISKRDAATAAQLIYGHAVGHHGYSISVGTGDDLYQFKITQS